MEDQFYPEYHAERIRDAIGRSRPIYTLTTFSKGQTDHVRIFGVKDGRIEEITTHVALLRGVKVKPHAGIAYRGVGLNKGLEAADDACRAIGRTLDQSTWFEL